MRQMKRLLKWTTRVVAVLALAIAAFVAYIYYASNREMSRVYAVTVPSIPIPTDAASIARGKYLVQRVSPCAVGHATDLGGKIVEDNFAMGRLLGPILSNGRGGLGATLSDQDYVRALLHGVKPDGRSVRFMPAADFRFSEADLGAIVAYVKSVPPVDRELPSLSIGPMARTLGLLVDFPLAPASKIDHAHVTFEPPPAPNDTAAGSYIVATAGCRACHGADFTGGGGPPPGASNITPVGIGNWTEQQFVTALREHKRPNGSTLSDVMPRVYGQMTDEDLGKIYAYLQTVPRKGEKTKRQLAATRPGSDAAGN
jgi:mono/diheme cytochrome c family protein